MGFGAGGWQLCCNGAASVTTTRKWHREGCGRAVWSIKHWLTLDDLQILLYTCHVASVRMEQILNSFGDIVVNACDSLRLHEECDLLSLRIDKVRK